MKSLGSILAQAGGLTGIADKPAKKRAPAEPRLHKVSLCASIYAEIEVMASTPEEAFSIAEKNASMAKRTATAAPVGFRACIQRMVDPRDATKGLKWVELVRDFSDPNNADSDLVWRAKR